MARGAFGFFQGLWVGSGGHLEGFEVPIHASLSAPILLGGAPRGIAIVNGTVAAALGLGANKAGVDSQSNQAGLNNIFKAAALF